MCFNKEVSAIIFFFGLIASIKLFTYETSDELIRYKYNAAGLFLFFVNLMQLVEFFLWSNQNTKTNKHQFWSFMVLVTIILQYIVFYASSFKLCPTREYYSAFTGLFSIGLIMFIWTLYSSIGDIGTFKSVPSGLTCRMNWDVVIKLFKKNSALMYLLFTIYIIFSLMSTNLIFGIPGLVTCGVILALSFMYSISHRSQYTTTTATLWCFFSVLLATVVICSDSSFLEV